MYLEVSFVCAMYDFMSRYIPNSKEYDDLCEAVACRAEIFSAWCIITATMKNGALPSCICSEMEGLEPEQVNSK